MKAQKQDMWSREEGKLYLNAGKSGTISGKRPTFSPEESVRFL